MTGDDGRDLPLDTTQSGDPAAIAQLYERYGDVVYRLALRFTGNSADAEDVLQDVFLGLPEALKSYAARGSLEGWIKRVAVRTALMKLRKQKTRRESSLERMDFIPGASSRESALDRVALERAFQRLPHHLRSVFVLKEIEGYTHAEIGEILGISVSASKIKLYRARKWLRQELEVLP